MRLGVENSLRPEAFKTKNLTILEVLKWSQIPRLEWIYQKKSGFGHSNKGGNLNGSNRECLIISKEESNGDSLF